MEDFGEVNVSELEAETINRPTFSAGRQLFTRELFQPSGKLEDPTNDQAVDYLRQIFSGNTAACGFKIKYPTQSTIYPEVIDELRQTPRVRVIELTRRNPIKQVISLRNVQRIKQTGQFRSSNSERAVELEPLELDIELAIAHARYFLRLNRELRLETSKFERVLHVSYEQIRQDRESTLTRILEFLDLDSNKPLASRFHKITPDRVSDAIANFEELAGQVRGTDLEQFLNE